MGNTCFHCGLPLDSGDTQKLLVLTLEREFCCPGCRAVCKTIIDAGLEDYYSHRREKGVTTDAVPEVIRKLGYYDHPDVQQSFVRQSGGVRAASLLLENIRCPACLWLNEQLLRGLEGVVDVELDYANHHARVSWIAQRIQLSEILAAIANIGYVAHPYDPRRRAELNAVQRKRSTERLIFAGVVGMMVMQFALAGYVMGYGDETGELGLWTRIGRWTSLFATITLLAYPGQEFFIGAWHDLRNRRLGMDVPIVLGLSIALLGSIHTTWTLSGEVYYDSIAMFVFLVLLARRFELKARVRAADALDRVGKIVPRLATRLVGGDEETVVVSELRPRDLVRVRPGEIVPADGHIKAGHSTFDESLLTGESLPVSRDEGSEVFGGACNIDQPVVVEISRDVANSAVAKIHGLLASGLRDAPRYAVLAQRFAAWFVGVVLTIASVTAAAWLVFDPGSALPNTVAVLIVTCPCALALATPVAAAISSGRLADYGVLQTHGDAMETLVQCDTFVFDKTGTLTTGELALQGIHALKDAPDDEFLQIAATLEQDSEHPIGRALRQAWDGSTLPVSGQHNTPGSGVSGSIAGLQWRLGRPEFALRESPTDDALATRIRELRDADSVVVVLANDQHASAVFSFHDRPRPGIAKLARELRQAGVQQLVVLSGDAQRSVSRFATGLGFDIALGDRRPKQKLAWIQTRQARGHRVAMMGDGVNDAPTLAAADVSISFTQATELAQVNSGILLLGNDPTLLLEIRAQACATRRIIRQNLVWAAAYNFLAVPAAAVGWIPPWGAAIGMSLSSLLVVVNSLRLRVGSNSDNISSAIVDQTVPTLRN